LKLQDGYSGIIQGTYVVHWEFAFFSVKYKFLWFAISQRCQLILEDQVNWPDGVTRDRPKIPEYYLMELEGEIRKVNSLPGEMMQTDWIIIVRRFIHIQQVD
jgi:hypothetical protein